MEPASTITNGISASCRDALVSIDGVGAAVSPTTVWGISSIQWTLPWTIISASAAGVYSVNSGVAPAPDIPGILEVSVVPITHINTGSAYFIWFINSSEPYVVIPSIIYSPFLILQ